MICLTERQHIIKGYKFLLFEYVLFVILITEITTPNQYDLIEQRTESKGVYDDRSREE
jgi:hypothetical protein